MAKEKTLVVYCAGGAGTNIGKLIEEQTKLKLNNNDKTPFAKVIVNYIDTSESNVRHVDSENIYLFEGIDGSGSERTRNKDTINDSIPDIILKMPPGDLNIIINSSAGGSGSVIGPMIASHLLKKDELVICMTTVSSNTLKHLKNTVNVLSTYETIARTRNKVLPLLLCNNGIESETNVNATICNAVQMLSILFSGKLDRLDSADLEHWINYNKVTSHDVGAVLLDISFGEMKIDKSHDEVCAVATIANSAETNTKFTARLVEYQTVGILPGYDNDQFKDHCLHFALIDGPIQTAYENHMNGLKEAEQIASSRKRRVSIETSDADNDGMVF